MQQSLKSSCKHPLVLAHDILTQDFKLQAPAACFQGGGTEVFTSRTVNPTMHKQGRRLCQDGAPSIRGLSDHKLFNHPKYQDRRIEA